METMKIPKIKKPQNKLGQQYTHKVTNTDTPTHTPCPHTHTHIYV